MRSIDKNFFNALHSGETVPRRRRSALDNAGVAAALNSDSGYMQMMDGRGPVGTISSQDKARASSCVATRNMTDVNGPHVIIPTNASAKVCGGTLAECCATCDADVGCVAFVYKAHEAYGPSCPSGHSYCWVLAGFASTEHSSYEATFGSKSPSPPNPPSPPPPPPPPAPSPGPPSPSPPAPPSPAAFTLTNNGELKSVNGECLAAVPPSGIEMWAKPMNASKIALLFVNPCVSLSPSSPALPLTRGYW